MKRGATDTKILPLPKCGMVQKLFALIVERYEHYVDVSKINVPLWLTSLSLTRR